MNPSVRHDDTRFLELLEKWQNGDFTRADEQALNALAASDDFRREAMEGFMSLPETAHDRRLEALRLRLRDRSGDKAGGARRIVLPQILAAAAALVLLLGAIWLFPKWGEKNAPPIAQTQAEPTGNSQSPELSQPPSAALPDDERSAVSEPFIKSAPLASGPSAANRDDIASAPQKDQTPTLAAAEREAYKAGEAADDQALFEAAPSPPSVAPAQGNLPAKPMTKTEKDQAVTRAKESSKLADKAKKQTQNTDSVWHETDRKPDIEALKKEAREAAQAQESEPANGWEAFREYLRQNARLTTDARNNNVSGSVRLQFTVNADGYAQGFVTLRSLGYGCDQEAVRLVQAWEWVRGKNPIVTVDVPFVR